jgi:long-chain acyl-CoA synthetase
VTPLDRFARVIAEQDPGRPAVLTPEETVSYEALETRIQACADRFAALGLRPGHRIAIALTTSPRLLALVLGALRCELMVSVLSAALSPADRDRRLRAFQPDYTIGPTGEAVEPPRTSAPSGCAKTVVFWTSGSTGEPKGVVLTADGLAWNARANAGVMEMTSQDRALVLLDGAYCYAMVHQMFSHLGVGGSVVIPRHPVWLPTLEGMLDRLAITTLAVVPSMLNALLGLPAVVERMRHLRLLTIGGAGCPESILAHAHAVLPSTDIRITYGLAEAGPRVCTRRYDPQQTRPGLVGHPLPGVEVRVSADGELLVRSPSNCLGELAGGALRPSGEWIPTGDLAEVGPTGEVRIRGRLKSEIKRGGIRILPSEIEDALRSHPQVLSARVVGVQHPRLGEVPKAYIVPVEGTRPEPGSLASYCMTRLRITSVPVEIDLVPQLPAIVRSWKEV